MYKILTANQTLDVYVLADIEAKASGSTPVWNNVRGISVGVDVTMALAVANIPGLWTEAVTFVGVIQSLTMIADFEALASVKLAEGFIPQGEMATFNSNGNLYFGQCFIKQHKIC